MQLNLSRFFIILSFVFVASQAVALDIYTFVESSCQLTTGIIVGVDDQNVQILDLSGHFKTLPKNNLSTIVIYSVLQNPISEITIDPKLNELAKEITVNENSKPLFTGWPIRFIEDLVIFFDTSGKTHVLDISDITKFRDPKLPIGKVIKPTNSQPVNFNFTDISTQCPKLSASSRDGIGPLRIISDKIAISEFMSDFDKGFKRIGGYEERTQFYAKPFLYEKRSKLGLIFYNAYKESSVVLPVYFQWSTGKPYHFQSYNVFGGAPVEWLPIAEPVFAARSDLKSHFFNASFVGNIIALSAGSSYYFNASIKMPRPISATNQFNYMALMGADYGPFSVSFGTYFPIFAFQVKTDISTEGREVLASSVSPAFRAMYTKGKLTLRAIYSATQESGLGSDAKSIQVLGTTPDNFGLFGSFIRGGVDYKLTEELKFGVDEIYSIGNYTENTGASHGFFNSTHTTTSAYLNQSFGYYISVRVFVNYYDNEYTYNFPNALGTTSNIDTSVGGAFEFLF